MIAYNHFINFISEFKNEKNQENSYLNSVTLKKSKLKSLPKTFKDKIEFPNNQKRCLTLYSNYKLESNQKEKIWAFEVKNVVTFLWHSKDMTLEYIKHDLFTKDLLKYWFLHVVLPVFFILEEIYNFLHAGAIEIDGKPVLFIAPSMGGKSTITDYFIQQGHTMVSDDKVATLEKDGTFYAVPSYSYHRPYRNIEDLGKFVKNFADKPKKIHVIYALERASSDKDVTIHQLVGIEKFKSLRDAKEMNLFFQESDQLEYVAKIAKKISVFRVTVPWSLDRLDEVYKNILEHSKSIKGEEFIVF